MFGVHLCFIVGISLDIVNFKNEIPSSGRVLHRTLSIEPLAPSCSLWGTQTLTPRVVIDVTFTYPYASANLSHTTTDALAILRPRDHETSGKYTAVLATQRPDFVLFVCCYCCRCSEPAPTLSSAFEPRQVAASCDRPAAWLP